MMSSPHVSIGILVYNEEEHLQETLATISAQTLGDFEAIISDNASTDATEQICEEHCARDSRFTYTRNRKNIGITANFNQVFQFTRGEYFKWWAADDLGAPTLVESCVNLLERDPGAVLAFGEGHFFKDDPTIPIGEPSRQLMPAMDGDRRSRFRAAMLVMAERPELTPLLLAAVMRSSVLAVTPLPGRFPASGIPFAARLAIAGRFLSTGKAELFLRHRVGSAGQIDTMGDYEAMIAASNLERRPLVPWIWARWRFVEFADMVLRSNLPLSERLAFTKIVGEITALRGRGWASRQAPSLAGLSQAVKHT